MYAVISTGRISIPQNAIKFYPHLYSPYLVNLGFSEERLRQRQPMLIPEVRDVAYKTIRAECKLLKRDLIRIGEISNHIYLLATNQI